MSQIVLIHLSDLHMSDSVNPGTLPLLREQPWLRQLMSPHHPLLSSALVVAIDAIRDESEQNQDSCVWLLVTGDLTACGRPDEFQLALTYLTTAGTPTCKGLNWPTGRLLAIPGNHDHMDGLTTFPYCSYNTRLAGLFPWTTWPVTIEAPSGDFELSLLGLDSNSGYQGRALAGGLENATARGRLSHDAIEWLDDELEHLQQKSVDNKKTRAIVSAVLLHHTLFRGGPIWERHQVLEEASREYLLDRARKYRIKALLSGHSHALGLKPFRMSGQEQLWEVRSPTTLQGPPNPASKQGFVVHRIWMGDSGHPNWEVTPHHWDGRTSFHASRPIQLD